jgi:hypothetical protein
MEGERLPLIDLEGEWNVMISDPRWEAMAEKDGNKNRMSLVLTCETNPTERWPKGARMDFYMAFVPTIQQSGKNKGRPTYEVAAETCVRLGMPDPFDPAQISELDGKLAVLVTKNEEWPANSGKIRCKAAFLNPGRRPTLDANEAGAIWAALKGEPVAEAKPIAAKPATGATFDPFGANALDDENSRLPF